MYMRIYFATCLYLKKPSRLQLYLFLIRPYDPCKPAQQDFLDAEKHETHQNTKGTQENSFHRKDQYFIEPGRDPDIPRNQDGRGHQKHADHFPPAKQRDRLRDKQHGQQGDDQKDRRVIRCRRPGDTGWKEGEQLLPVLSYENHERIPPILEIRKTGSISCRSVTKKLRYTDAFPRFP